MRTEERMDQVIRDLLHDDHLVLSDDMTAADVPGWDSLAHINIMSALETEFDVEFTDDQLTEFRNVGELRTYLARAKQA